MAPSCMSISSFLASLNRRSFTAAGLRLLSHSLDGGETTAQCWASDDPATDSPPKPTLVLIHGFGPDSTWQWRHQVRPLSRHFRLVVPDLLFFGGSRTSLPRRSEVFQAEYVVKLLDSMGIGRFSAVGTSYGGFVAYHVARMCGEGRVKRIVIASSDLLKREADDRELLETAGVGDVAELMLPRTEKTMRALIRLAVHRPPPVMPGFLMRDLIQTLYAENREEKLELLKGLTLGKTDGLEKLTQEVLIVWGEHDKIFPLEKAYLIQMQIGEKVCLEVMSNTAHVPQSEDPERFNRIIIKFLLGALKNNTS